MTFLVIFFLIAAAGVVVAGFVARWRREGQRIMRDATRPYAKERGNEDRLFGGKRRRRRRRRGDSREDYDVPLEIDLDDEEEGIDELAPPPFDFDGMNPDER